MKGRNTSNESSISRWKIKPGRLLQFLRLRAPLAALWALPTSSLALGLTSPSEFLNNLSDRLLEQAYRTSYATGDFNGDGFGDLAIGIPYATVAGQRAAGKVVVIDGDRNGLTGRVAVFHQAAEGRFRLPHENEAGDLVGFSLAAGDYNGDGITDLAVGAPGQNVDTISRWTSGIDAGALFVAHGLRGIGLDFRQPGNMFTQGGPGRAGRFIVAGEVSTGSLFGFALAAGDFDADGRSDLAVGLPGKAYFDNGGKFPTKNEGAVVVVAGTANGLRGGGSPQPYSNGEFRADGKSNYNLSGSAHKDDCIGYSLAAGDFNGDGFDDLAIGAPGQDAEVGDDRLQSAGAVKGAKGTPNGLDASAFPLSFGASGNGRTDLAGSAQSYALVGFSLASGDFNGDGRDDVAIGVPGRTVNERKNAGAVVVAAGADAGQNNAPILDGSLYASEFTQSAAAQSYDLPGSAQSRALVGFSLAAGDFDFSTLSRLCDLAIGAPGIDIAAQSVGPERFAGAVLVRFGSNVGGIASNREPAMLSQTSAQEAADLWDNAEEGDAVGYGVAAGTIGAGSQAELMISAPGERFPNPTLGGPLEYPIDQMYVDGTTHVVFGQEGVGLNAQQEYQYFWFDRFARGLQIDPLYVYNLFQDLTQDTQPIISEDYSLTYSYVDLRLKPWTDPALGTADQLYTDVTYFYTGEDRLWWRPDWQVEWDVQCFGVFFPVDRNIIIRANAYYEEFGYHTASRVIVMPDSDLWDDPVKVILLPNYAVEVIVESSP